jgi:hypothetical protein
LVFYAIFIIFYIGDKFTGGAGIKKSTIFFLFSWPFIAIAICTSTGHRNRLNPLKKSSFALAGPRVLSH